jgi:hypothetical protein
VTNQTISIHDAKAFAELVLAQADQLCTYEAVEEWDAIAWQTGTRLNMLLDDLQSEYQRLETRISLLADEHDAKPFWSKAFDSRTEEKMLEQQYQHVLGESREIVALAERLWTKIDFTPDTPEQKHLYLQELRVQKKELQLNRRQHTADMKAIRVQTRQQSAELPYTAGGVFFGRKYTAAQRRDLRYNQELALSPYEESLQDIDLQLRIIDQMILYLQRFP